MFWLHDAYHDKGGFSAWGRQWGHSSASVLTVIAGGFICVAGLYVTIKGIADGYASGEIPPAFTC
jgi:hypothetical protein